MKVAVTPIVVGVLGTVPKDLGRRSKEESRPHRTPHLE